MFSIYGESGRIFRGAMEDLWRVDALRGVMRARRLPGQTLDPRDPAAVAARRATASLVRAGVAPDLETDADEVVATIEAPPRSLAAGAALSAYAQASGQGRERQPLRRVADVMTRQPITVTADTSVFEAWRLLGERGVGQAPVLAGRASGVPGRLAGLISRAELLDLRRLPRPDAPADAWRELLMRPVSAVMFSPVPAVSPDADLRRVARVLLDTHLPGLPVLDTAEGSVGPGAEGQDDGVLVGFISRSDILQAVVHDPPLDLWG
jgi:CBS domain-containing protein